MALRLQRPIWRISTKVLSYKNHFLYTRFNSDKGAMSCKILRILLRDQCKKFQLSEIQVQIVTTPTNFQEKDKNYYTFFRRAV